MWQEKFNRLAPRYRFMYLAIFVSFIFWVSHFVAERYDFLSILYLGYFWQIFVISGFFSIFGINYYATVGELASSGLLIPGLIDIISLLVIFGGTGFLTGFLYERFEKSNKFLRNGLAILPWLIVVGVIPVYALSKGL